MMHKATLKFHQTQNLFDAIKTLVLSLPSKKRSQLFEEIQNEEWKENFASAKAAISKKFKQAGLTVDDVPRLIQEARQELSNEKLKTKNRS